MAVLYSNISSEAGTKDKRSKDQQYFGY